MTSILIKLWRRLWCRHQWEPVLKDIHFPTFFMTEKTLRLECGKCGKVKRR